AVAPRAHEHAVTNHRTATQEDRANRTRELEAFVRRVVAGVVEARRTQGTPNPRVEEYEVGITAALDRALSLQPKSLRRGGREQVDQPLDGQPALGDAFGVGDREQRLDAGRTVADPVERDAATGLGLLDRHPIRDVIRGDEIERAVGEAHPERLLIRYGPQWRRDHALGNLVDV